MRVRKLLVAAAMFLVPAVLLILGAPPTRAQTPSQGKIAPDLCLALAEAPPRRGPGGITIPSLVQKAQLKIGETRISYVGTRRSCSRRSAAFASRPTTTTTCARP